MSRTYVIADIGANHDGDTRKFASAVAQAKAAGCDAVKFQWVSDPGLMARRRGRAAADGYAAVYARYLAWPAAWHASLAGRCAAAGIDYMCTVFLPADVAEVAPHVARFKVASFEALDAAILDAHVAVAAGRPVIASAGMLSDGEAIGALRGGLVDRGLNAAVLQCVSAYPAPHTALNLGLLGEPAPLRTPVSACCYEGLSDHTDPRLAWTGALAVAAGATIVEAHLRLDDTDPANPDHPHAMDPGQFADYVAHIRFAEECRGDGVKRQEPCEAAMAAYRVR